MLTNIMLVINSERAALREAPAFRNKMAAPRLSMIKDIIDNSLSPRKLGSPPLSPTHDEAVSRSNSKSVSLRGSKQLQFSESGNSIIPSGYVPLDTIDPSPATEFSFDKLELRLSALSVKVDDESSSSDSLTRSYTSDPKLALSGAKSARSDTRTSTESTFKKVKPSYISGSKTARSMTLGETNSAPRASGEVSKEMLRQEELQALALEPLVFDLTAVTDIAVLDEAIRKITERKEKLIKINEGK